MDEQDDVKDEEWVRSWADALEGDLEEGYALHLGDEAFVPGRPPAEGAAPVTIIGWGMVNRETSITWSRVAVRFRGNPLWWVTGKPPIGFSWDSVMAMMQADEQTAALVYRARWT